MAEWLVILLRGPFASFADSPGNTTRKTGDMPSRSALIGLAAAALGIDREDHVGQEELAKGLVTASALLAPGNILTDFHTFQSLHESAKGAATRADAMARKDYRETAITRRDYRTDAIWQSAYRLSDRARSLSLSKLGEAFRRPHFALYIGRRSCPPSHPLNPLLYEAADVRDAFAAHAAETACIAGSLPRSFSLELRADAAGVNATSQHVRRDDPRDRSIRWTFADRNEWRVGPASSSPKEDMA
jgi:CRISPR system Cascade subunit CasD